MNLIVSYLGVRIGLLLKILPLTGGLLSIMKEGPNKS